jgi:hypothetical protein
MTEQHRPPTADAGGLALRVGLAMLFRYVCFVVMVGLAIWHEQRQFPQLPDRVLELVPFVDWVQRWNYWIWVMAYLPASLALVAMAPRRGIRFLVSGGLLSLARGVCIVLTGLGPVRDADLQSGAADPARWWHDVLAIANPFQVFSENSSTVRLTQDLFFSGHVATMFLLLLYAWPYRTLRRVVLVLHVIVLASVFLSHLHYTIDVVGAYAITFVLFSVREGRPAAGLQAAEPDGWR